MVIPEELTDLGQPLVVLLAEFRLAVRLLGVVHCPELVQRERLASLPDPFLRENHRPLAVAFDDDHDDKEKRGEDNHSANACDAVKKSFQVFVNSTHTCSRQCRGHFVCC
jgi:hypothetical protein